MKKFLIITCASFTAVMLLFCLLSPYDLAPVITKEITLQVFAMTATIAALMLLAEEIEARLQVNSLLADTLIRITICYAAVFIEGGLFGMFPFTLWSLLIISPIVILTFLFTYLIGYMTVWDWAKNINSHIQRKK